MAYSKANTTCLFNYGWNISKKTLRNRMRKCEFQEVAHLYGFATCGFRNKRVAITCSRKTLHHVATLPVVCVDSCSTIDTPEGIRENF
jgi:predicted metal-binding protein